MFSIKYKLNRNSLKIRWLVLPMFALTLVGITASPAFVFAAAPASAAPSSPQCSGGQVADSSGNCACPKGTTNTKVNGKDICEDAAIKCTSDNCDFVKKYVTPAITVLAIIFGSIAVISLIMGGIQYSSSGGDPQKVANAKKRLFNTIIAIFCFIFLFSFLQFLVPGGIFK